MTRPATSISSAKAWARCASAISRWWWSTPSTASASAPTAVWNYATGYGIPKMIVVNASTRRTWISTPWCRQLQEHFGRHVFPLSVPVNAGPGFNQVLDVLRNEIVTYATDNSGKYTEEPATGEWEAKVKELHRQLIEHIAESDDALMKKFFEQGSLSEEEFRAGMHAAVQKQLFIPLFCTSAENNIGVARLMDFIAKYGSSPVDRKKVKARGRQRRGSGGGAWTTPNRCSTFSRR